MIFNRIFSHHTKHPTYDNDGTVGGDDDGDDGGGGGGDNDDDDTVCIAGQRTGEGRLNTVTTNSAQS